MSVPTMRTILVGGSIPHQAGFLRIVGQNIFGAMFTVPAVAWAGVTNEATASNLIPLFLVPTLISASSHHCGLQIFTPAGRGHCGIFDSRSPLALATGKVPCTGAPTISSCLVQTLFLMWGLQSDSRLRGSQGHGVLGCVIGLNLGLVSDILVAMRDPHLSDWPHLMTPEASP